MGTRARRNRRSVDPVEDAAPVVFAAAVAALIVEPVVVQSHARRLVAEGRRQVVDVAAVRLDGCEAVVPEVPAAGEPRAGRPCVPVDGAMARVMDEAVKPVLTAGEVDAARLHTCHEVRRSGDDQAAVTVVPGVRGPVETGPASEPSAASDVTTMLSTGEAYLFVVHAAKGQPRGRDVQSQDPGFRTPTGRGAPALPQAVNLRSAGANRGATGGLAALSDL